MAGSKNFINRSKQDLMITLIIRNGADPANGNAGEVSFYLAAGQSHQQLYGDASNIYLNGISFSWEDNGVQLSQTQMVSERGSWWDNEINTNSTLTWEAVGQAPIYGSN